ncbi:RagB/SusD family nutrient uptake outer membrane protein [Niabella beijingensis]|uniref:RagB/SusD family nutrient uptake outer membrane protein n=1 Tax=Niabella beijingensis TaxID=2872700 RepID=UPI001CBC1CA2|nr:RagB/SusD family nutrient uptake outer membrane protein [Niabella beijingensis]MBZ4188172.1 RagB/SusD family nutrient uptake outer membrane protein [Niabella beijingensis]
MKLKYTFICIVLIAATTGCKKFLDRPPLTSLPDETAWSSEDNLRLYANKFYSGYFVGYGTQFSAEAGAALLGFRFSDDVFLMGNQSNFSRAVPNSGIWSMTTLRSINIMLDRIKNRMKNVLSEEAYNHWTGIGRFFRAMEYADLVSEYGDVPYFGYVPVETDLADLYKPRTSRNQVMDSVYEDLRFAMSNVRKTDGDQQVNQYIVAAFASRIALSEASWQKYYYNDLARSGKFFRLAQESADLVINSGKYDIVTDFRSLFTSNSLSGNKDVILYRQYDPAVGVTHSIATNNNLSESVAFGPSTDLIKSFICVDGSTYQESDIAHADDFSLSSMIKTRDSRLEATFYDKPNVRNRASYWYINKFLPRSAAAIVDAGSTIPVEFTSNKNQTAYPVFRYAEVLLNWIEAKAELGMATQADIEVSINKIRKRPLAPEATAKGVSQTAPLTLAKLPEDPSRDPSVPALLWEIRRERRMEFVFEYSRYQDLRRWKKLEYMDTDNKPDLLSGGWVNFITELPKELVAAKVGLIAVVPLEGGSPVVYNGSNGALMNGFYRDVNTNGRLPFLDQTGVNPYLSPVGKTQMDDYKSKGYKLEQTTGWPAYE